MFKRSFVCALVVFALSTSGARAASFPVDITDLGDFLNIYLDLAPSLVDPASVSGLPGSPADSGFFVPLAFEAGKVDQFGTFDSLTILTGALDRYNSSYSGFTPLFTNTDLGGGSLDFISAADAVVVSDLARNFGFLETASDRFAVVPDVFPFSGVIFPRYSIEFWQIPDGARLLVPGAADLVFRGNSMIMGFNDGGLDGDHDDLIVAFSDTGFAQAVPVPGAACLLGAGLLALLRRRC